MRGDLKCLKPPMAEKEVWERLQLDHFLLGIAASWQFGFPVEITHTSDRNPDFVIATPTQAIGVECSRITNEKLHREEHLEESGQIDSEVLLNQFLVDSGPMNNRQIIDAALGLGRFYSPRCPPAKDYERFWIRCAEAILKRKTGAMDKQDYRGTLRQWINFCAGRDYLQPKSRLTEASGLKHADGALRALVAIGGLLRHPAIGHAEPAGVAGHVQ